MYDGRKWISKVVEKRGVDELSVYTVLRLWSEGKIDEAVTHLKDRDEDANNLCRKWRINR